VKKAEKLDQVLILDEKRFVSILPAKRKAPKKRKAKPKKEISLTVDKKVLNNLKKILCSRDKNLIDQGHELLRSLGSAEASEYFLDGVSYTSQGEGRLIPSPMFTGTGPAQPFLNYAMLGVIAYAPEDCEAALALKKAITQLEMVLLFTEPLAEFENLKSLDLSGSEELENLDGLSSLKKLKHIDIKGCTALKNLKGLLNKTLDTKVLDLSGFSQLESLEGLQSMPKIKEINLGGCGELKNIDALQGLTNLKDIDFGYSYEGYYQNITSPESLGNIKPFASRQTELNLSCDKLKSLNGIEKFSKLSELQISSDSLTDISSLKGLQSLKILNIYALQLKSLKGIESLPELKELSLSCKELKTLEGLKDLPALKQLTIPDDCIKLIDLKGIAGATNITELFLHAGSLEDSTPIKHLVQLKNLDLSHCSSLRKFRGLNQLKNLKSITLNDCESLTTLDGVPGPHVFGDYQDFSNCPSLQDIRALKSSRIKTMHMDISGCSAIQKTQGLENIELNPLKIQNPGKKQFENLTNLNVKTINITEMNMTSFKGLKEWKSVTSLEIGQASEVKRSGFKTTEGIEAFPNLENLAMASESYSSDHCDRLEDLKGVDKLKKLRKLDLTQCSSIKDVASIAELPNLEILLMDGCSQVDPLPRPKEMETRDQVEKYQGRLLKSMGKAVPASSKKVSKKNKLSVDPKSFLKIKKLLTTRKIDIVNQGVELVRSLDDPSLYQKLLDKVGVHHSPETQWAPGNDCLVPNKIFKGTRPAQPYLDHAMWRLINDEPNDFCAEIRKKIKNLTVKVYSEDYYSNFLNLKSLNIDCDHTDWPVTSLEGLTSFNELTRLQVEPIPKGHKDLKTLSTLKKLESLEIGAGWGNDPASLITLDGLGGCGKLKTIEINQCAKLNNIDALQGCHGLESVRLSDASALENIKGLKGLKKINSVKIDGLKKIKNLDGLQGCESLEEIEFSGDYDKSPPLKNIDAMKGLKSLKSVTLSALHSLENINGLSDCTSLESILVDSNLLSNINGLKNLKKLTYVNLSGKKLKNIDGLLGVCKNLEDFRVDSESLENIDGLKGWHCENFDIPNSPKLKNLDALAEIKGLQKINFSSCEIKNFQVFNLKIPLVKEVNITSCGQIKSMEGVENLVNLTHLRIKDCSKLKTLNGLEGLKNLQVIILGECESLENVDALLDLPELETFKMHSCGIKKAELPKQLQVIVETRTNWEDWK
jgi:Leucine-rich repeat (LRR) protein